MNDAEKSYSTYERERLVIVFALKTFRYYILPQKLILFTNHKAFNYVINTTDSRGRIATWMSVFAEYDFEVHYRPGSRYGSADYLSRPTAKVTMILSMRHEQDLTWLVEFLTAWMGKADSSKFAKAIKVCAKIT